MLPKAQLTSRSTWLHIPGCLALGEWSHHHDYMGHEDLFLYSSSVYSCHLFLISSASVRSIPYQRFWLCGSQQTGKLLKKCEYQTILYLWLLRNLYAGQQATVITGHGTVDWFRIGKGVCQGYILSRCLFNLYACRVHHEECWAVWSTNWNQDCREKYQ